MEVVVISRCGRALVVADDGSLVADVRAALDGNDVVDCPPGDAEAAVADGGVELLFVAADAAALAIGRRLKDVCDDALLPMLAIGGDSDASREQAHSLGADDFLTVPLEHAQVQRRADVWRRLRARDVAARERLADARRLAALEDELARRVIHDLLSPVAGVEGFLALLRRDPGAADAPAMIEQALRAVAALRSEVEDLQRVRALEAAALTPRSTATDLHALVTAIAEALGPMAARRQVSIAVDGDPVEVQADALLLRRALEHVVTGAVRAAPRRSGVTVTVQQEGRDAVLEVADRGGGIDTAHRDTLFTRHTRVPQRGGLHLAALVVSLHRGSIAALDRDGGGTVVRVVLPEGW